jgi:hypothetical protein
MHAIGKRFDLPLLCRRDESIGFRSTIDCRHFIGASCCE